MVLHLCFSQYGFSLAASEDRQFVMNIARCVNLKIMYYPGRFLTEVTAFKILGVVWTWSHLEFELSKKYFIFLVLVVYLRLESILLCHGSSTDWVNGCYGSGKVVRQVYWHLVYSQFMFPKYPLTVTLISWLLSNYTFRSNCHIIVLIWRCRAFRAMNNRKKC